MNTQSQPRCVSFSGTVVGRIALLASIVLAALLFTFNSSTAHATVALTGDDPAFTSVWQAADQPVASGQVHRSWTWGPQPFAAQTESYAKSPNGLRNVLYFDKARMEITNPNGDRNSQWFVTTGLLTKELVSGKMQVDDGSFAQYSPAQVNIAGDLDSPGPTYADFTNHVTLNGNDNRASDRTGQIISDTVAAGGVFGQDGRYAGYGVTVGTYEPTLGHNIPAPLWNWMNRLSVGWLRVLGYPISEPYWMRVNIGGQPKDVLVQLFERRIVTYNPANSADWQVEYGNIGQHYYVWRYSTDSRTLHNIEDALAQLIQNERSHTPGLSPLFRNQPAAALLSSPVDAGATAVSRFRSQAVAQEHVLNHNPASGLTYERLLDNFHIPHSWAGEILAETCGYSGDDGIAQGMMTAWLNSPPHAAIIHNPNFDQFSIGVTQGSDGCFYAAGTFLGH